MVTVWLGNSTNICLVEQIGEPFSLRLKSQDNIPMHAKPDLRVFLKWMIARSGSVITDVIRALRVDNIEVG